MKFSLDDLVEAHPNSVRTRVLEAVGAPRTDSVTYAVMWHNLHNALPQKHQQQGVVYSQFTPRRFSRILGNNAAEVTSKVEEHFLLSDYYGAEYVFGAMLLLGNADSKLRRKLNSFLKKLNLQPINSSFNIGEHIHQLKLTKYPRAVPDYGYFLQSQISYWSGGILSADRISEINKRNGVEYIIVNDHRWWEIGSFRKALAAEIKKKMKLKYDTYCAAVMLGVDKGAIKKKYGGQRKRIMENLDLVLRYTSRSGDIYNVPVARNAALKFVTSIFQPSEEIWEMRYRGRLLKETAFILSLLKENMEFLSGRNPLSKVKDLVELVVQPYFKPTFLRYVERISRVDSAILPKFIEYNQ
jgi:hypothetical protein